MGRLPLALLAAAVLLAGCGGSDNSARTHVAGAGDRRPAGEGARGPGRHRRRLPGRRRARRCRRSRTSAGSAGPAARHGELGVHARPQPRRVRDDRQPTSGFVYGKTALYVAPTPGAKAEGPFPAPADVLLTQGRYRSKQAATEADPFAAVYAAQVPFKKPGKYSILAVTKDGAKTVAAPGQINVVSKAADRIPEVGERMPKDLQTDTLASAKGDIASIDTREPPDDMHGKSFADVVGKKPVALLIATPQLCQSRVCGPVVDVGEQMKSQVRRAGGVHPPRGLREQRPQARGCASRSSSSTWPPSRGCSSSSKDGTHHRPPRGVVRVSRRSRRRSRPRCDPRLRPRARAALEPADPGVAVRRGRPPPCSCVSFVALAALWPRPRLEHDGWRPLPGGIGRVLGSRAGRGDVRGASACCCSCSCSCPATTGPTRRWTTSRRRSSSSSSGSGWCSRACCSATSSAPSTRGGRSGGVLFRGRSLRAYPESFGRWPAAIGLLVFTWIELGSGWGEEPATLATAVAGYTRADAGLMGVLRRRAVVAPTARRSRSTSTCSRGCRCSRRATAWSARARSLGGPAAARPGAGDGRRS